MTEKSRNDVNVVTAVNTAKDGATTVTSSRKEFHMTDKPEGLTEEELAGETGEELPDREAMSLINANLAAPVNAAVALNVASDGSIAYANAEQDVDITQST